MERLVRIRSVATSYVLGWDRSIAEIFAEDYAQLALGDADYNIGWLPAPDATVLAAIKFDLGLGPEPEIARSGAEAGVDLPARHPRPKLGVGDPVQPARPGPAGDRESDLHRREGEAVTCELEIRCDGSWVAIRTIGTGQNEISIDRRDLGPASARRR